MIAKRAELARGAAARAGHVRPGSDRRHHHRGASCASITRPARPRAHQIARRPGSWPPIQNRDGACSATASWRSTTPASCFPMAEASPAPAGPPGGDRPSAPAAPAGDRLRRSSGELNLPGLPPLPVLQRTLVPLSPRPRGRDYRSSPPVWPCQSTSAAFPADPPRRRTTCPPPTRTGQGARCRAGIGSDGHNLARACSTDRKDTSARLGRPDVVDLRLPPIPIQSTAKRPVSAFRAASGCLQG
jgi:hypothetical protein